MYVYMVACVQLMVSMGTGIELIFLSLSVLNLKEARIHILVYFSIEETIYFMCGMVVGRLFFQLIDLHTLYVQIT